MTKGRKTTFEERVEIVQYCIKYNHNYAETAEKFSVSYQQARNYTIKYEKKGVDGLLMCIRKRGRKIYGTMKRNSGRSQSMNEKVEMKTFLL